MRTCATEFYQVIRTRYCAFWKLQRQESPETLREMSSHRPEPLLFCIDFPPFPDFSSMHRECSAPVARICAIYLDSCGIRCHNHRRLETVFRFYICICFYARPLKYYLVNRWRSFSQMGSSPEVESLGPVSGTHKATYQSGPSRNVSPGQRYQARE